MLISLLYNLRIVKTGGIIFFIFINNYLLLYSLNSRIFSLINILSVLTIAAAAVIAAAAEAATKIYIIITLAGAGFLILFTVLIISQSYLFTSVPNFFARQLIAL